MIDLLLLGSGAMVPLPNRPLSSLLVRSGGGLVLFDCGEGTQVQMRTFHWGFRRLDAICLSHLHADHVAGLPGLFHTVANARRTDPMHIHGPHGTAEVILGLRSIARWLPYEIIVHELNDGDRFALPNGLRAMVCEADHRITCLAYRVDLDRAPAFDPDRATALGLPRVLWSTLQRGESVEFDGVTIRPDQVVGDARKGVSFAYVTDTRPSERIRNLVQGVDLLVSEATYALDEDQPKAERHGHMTLRESCEQGLAANAGTIWLTHFSGTIADPCDYQEAARVVHPRADIGYPGIAARLSFSNGYERMQG